MSTRGFYSAKMMMDMCRPTRFLFRTASQNRLWAGPV